MLLKFADWLVYGVFGLNPESHFGGAVNFFVYDFIKIIALLYVMIFAIGVLRTFLSQNKLRAYMGGKGVISNVVSSVFGAVTPFCSCSSIPLFLSFLKLGVPLGVTFSFLITSPLINEYLVILMLGFLGWKITLLYVISGMMIGVCAGVILGKMNLEKHLVTDIITEAHESTEEQEYTRFSARLQFGLSEAISIVSKIWMWVLIGVGLGAAIHNYVPQETIQSIIGGVGIFSVPIAALLGVPMYGNCSAIVPIAVVLFQKGIPIGTALAFMMATAALSLPEAIMLRRAMKLPLILIFFAITTVSIIVIGYMLNIVQQVLI